MKQTSTRVVILLLLLSAAMMFFAQVIRPVRASVDWIAKTDPELLAATAGRETAEFLVVLHEQADLSHAARLAGKAERGGYVYETRTAVAARSQVPLHAFLDARGATYRAYWVINMLWVRGDRALLQALAARNEVQHIYANRWQRAQLPTPIWADDDPRRPDVIEWNIDIVNAPDVWAQGFTGQGVVIGGQDTGYDWQHEAIKEQYRGWDGNTADHNYNWHDAIHEDNPGSGTTNSCGFDLAQPCDDNGHGTHTMGIMVGETPDLKIGMAPGARWIGCRNMEEGWGSPATYSECYEWFIAPYPLGGDPFTDGDPARAPHVINNSWSCPATEGCATADVLKQVVEAVRAAGIVTVHSAGNGGPNCATVTTPAATYDASFTVGATDSQNLIADLSSRGPVMVDGSGRLKPDVVAPGINVHSSIPGNGYAFLSGTSMAAPHVAGLVALLISAQPDLAGRVNALEEIITQSALGRTTTQACGGDTATSVPNNTYGWGRIDALAAYQLLGTNIDQHEIFFPVLVPR
jgi:subtilisin family serine protease